MSHKKIFIVAGEPSGDVYASALVRDLRKLDAGLSFDGIGGDLSREAGVDVVFDISRLALVGVVEVVRNLFVVGQAFRAALDRVDRDRPDLAVLVDYPGFNLRLARALKKRGIPVVYYVSPQVWVWGRDRIQIIRECVEKMLCFFDFEERLYRDEGVSAEWVGHPLVETVRMTRSLDAVREKFSLARGRTTIAFLPGSRRAEVERLLPVMARAGLLLAEKGFEAQFVIAKHPSLPIELYRKALEGVAIDVRITEGETYNVLGAADFAIVASGTATLETAIIGTPLVIVYRTNALTAFLARKIARFKYLGLVNILAGREIAPEFLQEDATPKKIAAGVAELLGSEEKRAAMKEDLRRVRSGLGEPGAGARAARAVYAILTSPR